MIMLDGYFIIGCTPDGLTFAGPFTFEQLRKRLTEDGLPVSRWRFADKVPRVDGFCPRLKDNELVVIRGSIVKPELEPEDDPYEGLSADEALLLEGRGSYTEDESEET